MKQEARKATAEVKEAAGRAACEAKSRLSETVHQRKSEIADQVSTFSAAARDAAGRLQDDGSPGAQYLQTAADSLDRTAEYLKNSDLNELINGAERFTRRHPEVVLGGLFLAGVGIARFLKASNDDRHRSTRGRDFDAEMWPNNREMKPVSRYGSDHRSFTNDPAAEAGEGTDWVSVGGDITPRSETEPHPTGDPSFSENPNELNINSPYQRAPR